MKFQLSKQASENNIESQHKNLRFLTLKVSGGHKVGNNKLCAPSLARNHNNAPFSCLLAPGEILVTGQ